MTGHGSHAAIEMLAAFVLVVTGAIVLALAAHQRRRALAVGVPSAARPAMAEPGDPGRLSVPVAVVVALSLGAAAIHLAAGPSHVEELGDLGLGFYWAALFQGGWAIAYAARRRIPRPSPGPGSPAASPSARPGPGPGPSACRWVPTPGDPRRSASPTLIAATFQLLLAGWLAWELARGHAVVDRGAATPLRVDGHGRGRPDRRDRLPRHDPGRGGARAATITAGSRSHSARPGDGARTAPDDPVPLPAAPRRPARHAAREPRLGWATMTDGRAAPHPDNTLNELTGEEWLYFTKSVLTTAYPSELGHVARKAHGANKPPGSWPA